MWAARPHLGSIFEKLLHRKTFYLCFARCSSCDFCVLRIYFFPITWYTEKKKHTDRRNYTVFATIKSLGLFGLNAFPVDVEVDIQKGLPHFDIVGLPDAAVKESRERIRAALYSISVTLPPKHIVVNLAPADVKKSGTMHDLAILVGVLKSMGQLSCSTQGKFFIGEVSLSGEVRSVNGVLPMTILARSLGVEELYVPADNAAEAATIQDVRVFGIHNIGELIDHLEGDAPLSPAQPADFTEPDAPENLLDFSDVKGQQTVKRALEIVAAGGHNVLLVGAPGSGKSMLAKRMPYILPEMTMEESIETTNIYSISGLLDPKHPLITKRPFRAPHHTISGVGLVGGGTIPHPGEISLAHNGLLFLDELAEFDRHTLDILRQPLEDHIVTITRAAGTISYPCRFMLVGAMNPCPCGYYGHPKRRCSCSPQAIQRYRSRISGPLLERFDLQVEVDPVSYEDLTTTEPIETSADIRKRVQAAREIQEKRFSGTSIFCNAQIPAGKLQQYCPMEETAERLVQDAFDRLGLSARSYDRLLKVGRTIADLAGSACILRRHMAAAIQYCSLSWKYLPPI
jgi:magnesium chelatase family protein